MNSSPFNLLPSELISEVFQYCLPDKPSFVNGPLPLTQVCQAWRTVAIGTPRLWARIVVPDWQELPQNVGALVKLWISRSGEAPLEIDINMFNEDLMIFPGRERIEDLYQLLREVLASLVPLRTRIFRFHGVFPEFLMFDVGISEMRNAEQISYCGMLEDPRNELQGMGDDGVEPLQSKLDLGPPRESLRSLTVCGCAVNLAPIRFQTQLGHLELLDLHNGGDLVCQETAFELLQSLPNLKTCILDLTRHERQDWTTPSERTVLENMELLFISWAFPADIDLLLQSFSTPNLTKLGLRGTPMVAQRPWNGLRDFLAASRAPLKRISIGDFGAVDAQLLECFAYCPELEHFTMNHCEMTDNFFRSLTCSDEMWNRDLLPHLHVFNIGVCEGFTLDSVLSFLKSRATISAVPMGFDKLSEAAFLYCVPILKRHAAILEQCGVDNLILEAVEDVPIQPYARVVETHRELLAVLYTDDEEDLPPFDEGWSDTE